MAGIGEARAVEHVLGDRVGHDGGGRAGADIGDGAADGGKRRRRAACRRAGRASAVTATPMSTTGKRVAEGRVGGCRLDHRDVTSAPICAARRARNRDRRECRMAARPSSWRRRQAATAISGPIPAGSPSVSARTRAIRLLAALDHRVLAQLPQISLRFLLRTLWPRTVSRACPPARACRSWSRSWSRPQTSRCRAG